MDDFHLSEHEVRKVVFVCYVAVVCHKLRSVLLENSCDILCKCGSKLEGHLNVLWSMCFLTLGYGSASTRYQATKESQVSLGLPWHLQIQ